jgi:hypothetical protein
LDLNARYQQVIADPKARKACRWRDLTTVVIVTREGHTFDPRAGLDAGKKPGLNPFMPLATLRLTGLETPLKL